MDKLQPHFEAAIEIQGIACGWFNAETGHITE